MGMVNGGKLGPGAPHPTSPPACRTQLMIKTVPNPRPPTPDPRPPTPETPETPETPWNGVEVSSSDVFCLSSFLLSGA